MRRIIATLAASLAVWAAGAQQKWTLRQCIDHAVENNIEIRQTALAVEGAEIELNTARNSRLPDLSAGAGQRFGFGRALSSEQNRYVDLRSSSTSLSLSASLPVFGGFRINNQVKAGRLNLAAAAANLEKVKQSVELNVAGYYLDVLFKKEILAVNRHQSALTRRQVENTVRMVEEGRVATSQLYDIKAQLAQNELDEVNASSDLALSLLNLSQALNLDFSPEFDVVDVSPEGLTDGLVSDLRSPDAIYGEALGVKPSVREAELRLEGSRYGVKIAQSARWPQISLGVDVGNAYEHRFGQTNANFATQLRNNRTESVGLNVSIPIFNRYATRNSVRAAKLEVENQSLALEGARLSLYKEVHQAWQRTLAARARYQATTTALDAAEESFRAMELRYENGKATAYEYSEAGTKLISSRSEQAQAKYDLAFCTRILDFYAGRQIDI